MGQLDGKVAIVTGTSRGVGVGIAKRLLEEGANVAGCSRRELEALPGADAVDGGRDRSVQWVCDQGDWRQIDGFVKRVADRFGRLDILVNNAGGTIPTPHVEDVPAFVAKIQGSPAAADSYERTVLFHELAIQNNLISPLWFALRACREMAKQESTSSIINISSGASHPAGSPTLVSYGAAKAGLNHMTRSLAQEWGPKIRVNCLALGPTLTEGFRAVVLGKDDPAGEDYFQVVPLRRGGEPEEVGNACVFLCAGGADVINGTTIEMDGGMLPGSLYERGIQPIKQMLAARATKEGRGS